MYRGEGRFTFILRWALTCRGLQCFTILNLPLTPNNTPIQTEGRTDLSIGETSWPTKPLNLMQRSLQPHHDSFWWEGLVLSVLYKQSENQETKQVHRHKPWPRPRPSPPSSSRLWCGPCSAHMCSQRSIVFSAVVAFPLTSSGSPRMQLSAPLPLRSYPENAAQSWEEQHSYWCHDSTLFTHSPRMVAKPCSVVWLSVPSIRLTGLTDRWILVDIREVTSHLTSCTFLIRRLAEWNVHLH